MRRSHSTLARSTASHRRLTRLTEQWLFADTQWGLLWLAAKLYWSHATGSPDIPNGCILSGQPSYVLYWAVEHSDCCMGLCNLLGRCWSLTFTKRSGIRIPPGFICETPNFAQILHSCAPYHPFNTLRTGLLNCLNARSRGLTFRHRASCI